MNGGDAVLDAKGLRKTFDQHDRVVIDSVSLTIGRGETVALVGPSGSGKTTLLSILAGLLPADEGTLTYRFPDFGVSDQLTAQIRRRCVGLVFQLIHLVPTLTVAENIEIPMFGVEADARRRTARAREILDTLGLLHLADKLPSQLSGGERQRVAVGRAFANAPTLVLADEPTGSLDTAASDQVVSTLLDMTAAVDGSLLVVTHDPAVAERLDRTLTLIDGHIVDGALPRQ